MKIKKIPKIRKNNIKTKEKLKKEFRKIPKIKDKQKQRNILEAVIISICRFEILILSSQQFFQSLSVPKQEV